MELRPTDEQDFLAALGRRVRHMRALRGMSRKVLARVSGISERYIAQLESGKGNVSIKLLRRAAAAMGTRVEDLVVDVEIERLPIAGRHRCRCCIPARPSL